MRTLMDLENNDIVTLICANIGLFDSLDAVYLFGSVLDSTKIPNDLDVLLIYSEYSDVMIEKTKQISYLLEGLTGLGVDLTVLSVEEENG